jgi:hypothetical protein
MDTPGKDGTTPRQHVAGMVKRYRDVPEWAARVARWEAELAGPPVPPALQYLLEWLDELFGRSGATMDGLAPLSYTTVRAWAELTDRCPRPHEVQALLMLDAVRRHPPPDRGAEDDG